MTRGKAAMIAAEAARDPYFDPMPRRYHHAWFLWCAAESRRRHAAEPKAARMFVMSWLENARACRDDTVTWNVGYYMPGPWLALP